MTATVQIVRKTGSPPTATDITSINTRANAYDGHSTADTTYPIRIPATSANFSYWVTTRLNIAVSPAGTINNVKWYTDGDNGLASGVTCNVALASTGTSGGYVAASGTIGLTGTQLLQATHSGLNSAPINAFSVTSTSSLALTATISNPDIGEFGDHVVYQIAVDSTASAGATATETFTWAYDET